MLPIRYVTRVGAYVVKQHLMGRKRYPLVTMLEPLFRCNLACSGCGKIDYPDAILNQRLSVEECVGATEETGAPVVSIAGGEPLLHKEMPEIVRRLVARKKFVILCTNALLLKKRIDEFKPSPYFTWDIHLDGDQAMHDAAVDQDGVYERAVEVIKLAKEKGFRVNTNSTFFDGADPDRVAKFFDEAMRLGVDGLMVSPGYAYERAPDQQHFLNRQKTKQLFREVFKRGKGRGWQFTMSPLFLDFLAGNETYECTPWGIPTRNVFGWQRPCYLLGEGYAKSYKELMETTDWDSYGTGNYEKCADCMVHSGFEPTAVLDGMAHPWKMIKSALRGPRTDGPLAPEIPLDKQRPAQYVFSRHVEEKMAALSHAKPDGSPPAAAAE